MKRSARILPLPLLIAAHTAAGVVFYSGYQNLIVPLTLDGAYLNPVTGATAASHPSDWNTSPWINPFFGGVYAASSDLLRPVVIGANEIVNLPAGTLIDGTDNFPAGESGSSTHVGPGAGQFQLGTPGLIGFAYRNILGTGTILSTGEVVPVPEPSGVFLGLAMCALAGWRERRRERHARRAERRA